MLVSYFLIIFKLSNQNKHAKNSFRKLGLACL